jgi:hypothetical protein
MTISPVMGLSKPKMLYPRVIRGKMTDAWLLASWFPAKSI